MTSDSLRMVLNGRPVAITAASAATTLLDWLREDRRLTGTKEGCGEGDCGACTVVLEDLRCGRVRRRAVNACLLMLGQIDGLGVRTVEGLLCGGTLHPIQLAYAGGGTQCGFCTPGFVMATYAYAAEAGTADLPLIHDALAGNLCRCTGYRTIIQAVRDSLPLQSDPLEADEPALKNGLAAIARNTAASFVDADCAFYAPRSLAEALELRQQCPTAKVLAGGTDLGLVPSQKREKIQQVIYLGAVEELKRCDESSSDITIGAAVPYEEALAFLSHLYPGLAAYLSRLGSRQIRNLGTVGGNIGTASPIGDFLPILLALSARIRLCSLAGGPRDLAADSFFISYRKTALRPDELIEAVVIPTLALGEHFWADKITKRRDQDISTVCSAFLLALDGGKVSKARLAFGGMAPIPMRARGAEAALLGRPLDEVALAEAGAALARDVRPVTDWRGSSEYRLAVAQNLLRRLYARIATPQAIAELEALPAVPS
jgi:xanthine dehydrogenase small subunit